MLVGDQSRGGVDAVKKDVSLWRSQSDNYRRNRPPTGDDGLRPTVSSGELVKVKVRAPFF